MGTMPSSLWNTNLVYLIIKATQESFIHHFYWTTPPMPLPTPQVMNHSHTPLGLIELCPLVEPSWNKSCEENRQVVVLSAVLEEPR